MHFRWRNQCMVSIVIACLVRYLDKKLHLPSHPVDEAYDHDHLKYIQFPLSSFQSQPMHTTPPTNIGLAFSGGAVLGAAHVGVLKALDEYEVRPRYLSGTSIGAFIASLYAFGVDWRTMENMGNGLSWIDVTGLSLSRYALLSNEKLGKLITKHIGQKNLEDAPIPLALVATDISNGEKVILREGPVDKAVMASTCIPGIFKPIEIDGRLLVDGGIVENTPIATAKDLGADYVIAIDVLSKLIHDRPNHIVDIIINSFHYTLRAAALHLTEEADLAIVPNTTGFSRSRMGQIKALMAQGYKDALEMLRQSPFERKDKKTAEHRTTNP